MYGYSRIIAPVLCLLATVLPGQLAAHEFWISPETYQVPSGATIEARFRNGENFKGVELAYFESRSTRHEMATQGRIAPVPSRSGDRPAIVVEQAPEGLLVLAHETTQSRLTYRSWEKFAKFAAHKDFPDIQTRHAARDLPTDTFRENYSRHVKALIGVGRAEGTDRPLGLITEFVALTNPYDASFYQKMRVQLFYKSQPRANAQVEVFDRAPDGTVSVRLTRTDGTGTATLHTLPGHTYLIDAVVLRVPEQSGADIAWETLWAGLTFAVPN